MRQIKSIAAVGGAVALIGIWPLAVGQIGQTVFTDAIQHAANPDIKVELVQYDRGYLTSKATTRMVVVDPQLKAELTANKLPTSIVLKHDISHGIFSLTGQTHLEGHPQLMLTTQTQLNGNTEFHSDIPAQQFDFTDNGLDALVVGNSKLNGSISVLGKLDYEISVANIELDYKDGMVMSFNGLSSQGEGAFEQGMWLGEQTSGIDGFLLSDSERVSIAELSGMKYHLQTTEDKQSNTLQGQYHLTFDELHNADGEAKNLDLQFDATGFNKDAFVALSDMYKNSPVWTDQDTVQALPHLDDFLKTGFKLSLKNFSVDIDMGHFKSSWDLNLPANKDSSTQDVLKLIDHLDGDMHAFVSSDLVLAYPYIQQNLDELMIMEIATKTDEGYELNIQLKDGKLMFSNGKAVPVMSAVLPIFMQKH
ncbi:YdgA family protein [Vibrio gallicus]|uniref:YdgA family protein n=1 Tax=Vibrio gallicus TaxID=190897 RepID=UPI0021C2BE72|nr:YdgA family protein [Vibrio gallicus]